MKLSGKYHRHYLLLLVAVLLLGFLTQYVLFRYSLHRSTDDVLREYRLDFEDYARRHGELPVFNAMEWKHGNVVALHGDTLPRRIDDRIYDTVIYSAYEREPVVYRVLNFVVETPGRHYLVTLTHPMWEEDEMVGAALLSSLCLFLFFLGLSLVSIRRTRRTVAPFYHILDTIRHFEIGNRRRMEIVETDVDEFNELQRGLDGMMQRIRHDYDALKELMENASHELQTPLAVARMKVEQLAQLLSGNREQMLLLADTNRALMRMTRYNRSLLMIARISSDQFYARERMDLTVQAERFLQDHEEIIEARGIRVVWSLRAAFEVDIHPVLAEMLVNNLLSNALKFSCEQGEIVVAADSGGFRVENTFSHPLPVGDLFRRYTHTADRDDSFGLGLPLVKEICEHNALKVGIAVEGQRFVIAVERQA